jgi:hypothetical protein
MTPRYNMGSCLSRTLGAGRTCTSHPFSRRRRASRSRAEVVVDAVIADSCSSASCWDGVRDILAASITS